MKLKKSLWIGIIALSGIAYSCGGSEQKSESTSTTTTPAPQEKPMSLEEKYQNDPDYIKGLALIKENDCPSCHMVDRKIVGPSYAEIAAKYETSEENIKLLAERVIAGTVGVWGEIPMVPHPTLSQEDAEQMVKYVLILKK